MNLSSNPSERLRVLESEYSLTRDRISILNQAFLESYKKLSQELRLLHQEIHNLKSEISELKLTNNHLIQEIPHLAKKDQVKILEKYINLWNPLHFATQSDLQEMLKQIKQRGEKHRTSAKAKTNSKSRWHF